MTRFVAIDHGDRRIGVAISDAGGSIARPYRVVHGEAALFELLDHLIPEEEVGGLVLGLPLNMDGSEGPKARQVLAFRERLEARYGLPVDTWDERLTSCQAEDLLVSHGVRGQRRKDRVDMVAAQLILQSFLDRRGSEAP